MEKTMEAQVPPPTTLPPPPPEVSLPLDGILRRLHIEEGISTARLGFCYCYPSVADKTLDGDGGDRVIRRRRVRRMKGAGGRAGVIGLGNEVQRRRGRCPL